MKTDEMLFVLELSSVLTKYNATIEYTNDDDGLHISTFGKEVFVGFLSSKTAGQDLYKASIKK